MSENQRNQPARRLDNPYDSADQGDRVKLGGKAEPKTSFGEPSDGLFGDAGDGTIGGVGKEFLERQQREARPQRGAPSRDADDVGGMGTGSGRGRGSGAPGGVYGSGDSAGTGGGVAVSAGRGSDLGTVGGGMESEASPNVGGGISGGTMGGSRESDLGGGLSGGMRSGMGHDVSGGMGGSVGDEPGMPQPHGVPAASEGLDQTAERQRRTKAGDKAG